VLAFVIGPAGVRQAMSLACAAPTTVRYAVLAGLSAAALLAYVQRNSIGVVEKEIRADLRLSEKAMGLVMSGFFISYALLQIPTGWLAHKGGTRRTMPAFMLLGSAAMGVTGLASGLAGLLAARLGMGAGQAGLLPCATASVSRWLPATKRAFASGVLGAAMSVGGALGAALTATLVGRLGWRWLFLLYALPGLFWAAWFGWWFRDRPEDHPGANPAELALIGPGTTQPDGLPRSSVPATGQRGAQSEGTGPTPWASIVASPAMAAVCGQQFFRAAGYMFFASWFTTYLRESRGVPLQEAGLLTSLPLAAVVAGTLVGGLTSDALLTATGSRRLARQGVSVVSMVSCAVFILLARPVADPWAAVLLITAGSFCSSFAGPCAYAVSIDMGGRNVALVFATMNMAGNLGAMLLPLAVPLLVGPGRNWDLVLLSFAGLYLAAAACWLALNPRRTIGE
jgi:ACS family glucarate transporter-like MFS transporter